MFLPQELDRIPEVFWSKCRWITELKGKRFGQTETSLGWNPKCLQAFFVYKSTAPGIITGFLRITGDDIWGNIWKEAMLCSPMS